MVKNTHPDFSDDEKMEKLQTRLDAAQKRSEEHKTLDRQSKVNLEYLEKNASEAAVKLAEQQGRLADLSQKKKKAAQKLEQQLKQLNRQAAINQEKANTLQSAREDLEKSQLRYSALMAEIEESRQKVQEYDTEIAETKGRVKTAYYLWKNQYEQLQKQKQAAEQNARSAQEVRRQIENLQQQREDSKNQAADQLADTIILNLNEHRAVTDLPLAELPKATLRSAIPDIPPLDDEMAKLIQETRANNDGPYASLRPQITVAGSVFALENSEEAPNSLSETEKNFWEKGASVPSPSTVFGKPRVTAASVSITETDSPAVPKSEEQQAAEKPPQNQSSDIRELSQKQETNNEKLTTPPAENPAQTDVKKKHFIPRFLLYLGLAVVLALLLRHFVFQITEISGDSMEPTLISGERAISSPIPYYFNSVERFDIIVFEAPDRTDGAYYVKRVIGLPGEHVIISGGIITINGEPLQEDYINGTVTSGEVNTLVPNGELFVLGDNRAASHDSRNPEVGTISQDAILGQILYQVYPFDQIGAIE